LETIKLKNGAGVTELANHLGLSKGSVHTHLSTLDQYGYVRKENGLYKLGFEFICKSSYVKSQVVPYSPVKKQLVQLAMDVGEYTQLMIEHEGRGIYFEKLGGTDAVGSDYHIGEKWPLHSSAAGKAILAELGRDRVNEIIGEHGLAQKTENTINTRDELIEELETIRERGFAYNLEETAIGIRALGVSITVDDRVYGSISISGPIPRMQGEKFHEELPEKLTSAANMIEIKLRYSNVE